MELKMKNTKTDIHPFYLTDEFRKVNTNTRGVWSLYRGLFFIFTAWTFTLFSYGCTSTQEKSQVVRIARIEIDSAQLEQYKAALKEEIETSLRVESGVLTLYAVSEKNNPANITIIEIYADADAYQAHLETPHFKKYKYTTKDMVKSLELVDVVPITIATKAK